MKASPSPQPLHSPEAESSLRGWPEVLLLSLAALVLPLWLVPADPFLSQARFDWNMLLPLLVSLHYGVFKGLVSFLSIAACQYLLLRFHLSGEFYIPDQQKLAGWGIVILICGEYSQVWKARHESLKAHHVYLQDRFDTFTRYYHLLQSSHNRLEKRLAGQAISLRESLQYLRSRISQLPDRDIKGCAQEILEILSSYGGIQVAGFYVSDDGKTLNPIAAASCGSVTPLVADDPLLNCMLENKRTVSIKDTKQRPRYQLCIPLTDIQGALYGAVLVESIQFFSLQDKKLTLLTVMASHIGDLLRHQTTLPVLDRSELQTFGHSLTRARHDACEHGSDSQLLRIRAAQVTDQVLSLFIHLEDTRRTLDIYLKASDHDYLILMPLTNTEDCKAFLNRLNSWCCANTGYSLTELNVSLQSYPLGESDHEIRDILKEISRNPANEITSA
ncbi:PelD GGDEF domain-containing protein [Marinobacterium jannaschii]|uniref:PelD GGDEF domain-containing protein n=1 Tax=Marinobacterium jannaschii TaxID=64970 RepID=UPI00047F7370|nr:PelD GGDEF domain-containing protein [Marinobacterium jannaschii]